MLTTNNQKLAMKERFILVRNGRKNVERLEIEKDII